MNKAEITPEQLAENPLLAVLLLLITSVGFTLLVGAIATWIWLGRRLRRGEPILPIQPWTPRAWGLLDLAFVFITLVSFQIASVQIARVLLGMKIGPGFTEEQMPISAMAMMGLGNLLAVLIATTWIALRLHVSLDHLGFRRHNLRGQIALGLVAAFGSLPMVYMLMFLISQGTNTEYDHPLINKMLENATLSTFLLGSFSAVIAAPLAEEFLFRVILQGWLQSIVHNWSGHAWFWGAYTSTVFSAPANPNASFSGSPQSQLFEERRTPQRCGNESADADNALQHLPADQLVRLDRGETAIGGQDDEPILATLVADAGAENMTQIAVPPLWPSLVSGVLFGVAHWGYGLSFVPLIALGIVLGLLYRATHSIWPGLVVHLSLNLLSMLALALAIASKQAGVEP